MKKSDFKKLKDLWYQKLAKETDFEDIEKDERSEYVIRKTLSLKINHKKSLFRTGAWIAKYEYYRMADDFLHIGVFDCDLDRIVWEYHANGISLRNISKLLEKVGIRKKKKDTIGKIVRKYESVMKETLWAHYMDEENEQ